MTLNNDAETKRCKGDRIRGCVSISDADTKWDKKMQWQKDAREIELEDVY